MVFDNQRIGRACLKRVTDHFNRSHLQRERVKKERVLATRYAFLALEQPHVAAQADA
jgi:hypothetical protein